MLTFHSIVRGFEGEFDWIQRNAIKSWQRLHPYVQVLLFGDDEVGAISAATDLGCTIYPLARNHRDIPLVRYPIERAQELARHDIRCLINADVILLQDFMWCVSEVEQRFDVFLLVTQRWGLKIDHLLQFRNGWDVELLHDLRERGHAKHRKAVDYFCYRGDFWNPIPDFAVGRMAWDNWLVWKALKENVPVIDATPVSVCIHQDHAKRRVSVESSENQAIYADTVGADSFRDARICGLNDATHWLTRQGVVEK